MSVDLQKDDRRRNAAERSRHQSKTDRSGHLSASLVHPREVFKPAILGSATALIVEHNHPSGDLDPSPEDLAMTVRLQQAGELLGIPVLDPHVCGDPGFVSLTERGLLSVRGPALCCTTGGACPAGTGAPETHAARIAMRVRR